MCNTSYKVQKSKLYGSVSLSGAKNSVLRLQAASILTEEKVILHNSANGLLDVTVQNKMLGQLGKSIITDNNSVIITQKGKLNTELIWEERSIRNTLLILGALLSRYGKGKVPIPGGCNLGERKYDLHVMIFEKMGAKVWQENNYLCAEVLNKINGTEINLPIRSTGATENGILCGVLAKGKTQIWNPHIRPEIIDLIKMLNKMGAKIQVFGQEKIEIEGVDFLKGVEHEVIPDNMEALTWLIASVITNGDVEIKNFPYEHLEVPLIYLRESGAKFYRSEKDIIVRGGRCYPVEISTGPYPGINSDMQPLFAVYGALAKGVTKIIDLRFPGRYGYAEELFKMGVEYKIVGDLLVITGGNRLMGTTVTARDLRAGIALLIAGMSADGVTTVRDFWQVERGYEKIIDKLVSLNVNISTSVPL